MFRRMIMAIFRLYMKYLLSSYANHVYMGKGGGKVGTRSRICQEVWAVWVTWRVHAVTKLSKLIIVKSMVGIILCLCVLCNYIKCTMYNNM